ncbi:MAG: hypothetical protein ACJAVM_000504 [Sulfitobacter sp.]|jgi:hypothetical protein
MTVLEDVSDLIKHIAPATICDDCIADKLRLSVRQHANHKTRELSVMKGFERRKDNCSACGADKLVINYA